MFYLNFVFIIYDEILFGFAFYSDAFIYLFTIILEAFGTTWTKYYCYYQKETREFKMISYNQVQQKMVSLFFAFGGEFV